MTLVERVDGEDIPVLSTEDPNMQRMRDTIKSMATEMVNENGEFMIALDEPEPAGQSTPTEPIGARKAPTRSRMTAKYFGIPKEAKGIDGSRERRTVQAVKQDLMALQGECINFCNVHEILLSRWNANCFSHINDRLIVAIIKTLLKTDIPREAIENRIAVILAAIDENTDEMDENRFIEPEAKKNPAPVITFRTGKRKII